MLAGMYTVATNEITNWPHESICSCYSKTIQENQSVFFLSFLFHMAQVWQHRLFLDPCRGPLFSAEHNKEKHSVRHNVL